jgi:branched-chain amino acid transport system ATP-binding protein
VLRQIVASGVALILVEQYVTRAIEFADTVYLMNRGTIAYSGPAKGLDGDELFARYLGDETP